LNHVRETLEALKKNDLAAQTTLYITSDGPMPGHEEDCVPAPSFLSYFNANLDRRGGCESVFSITGHTPPVAVNRGLGLRLILWSGKRSRPG
jgi:hypothetical protein